MSFTLEKVVPWGRSFDEYLAMFSLSKEDLGRRLLGCGDGPASFHAELTKMGGRIVSVDLIYRFSASEIKKRIDETYDQVMEQTRNNENEFVWDSIKSVVRLGRIRMEAMSRFLEDYSNGKGKYIPAALPDLPFHDGAFDLALCSHFLFLYSAHHTLEFHIQSLRELCRIASEVRVFPLLELGAKRSRHLDAVIDGLSQKGHECKIKKVPYEFQRGGNEMLRITYRIRPCHR
jgi:hypothetical protein